MSTYVPVAPPPATCSAWHRVPWYGLLWIGGTAGALAWYARHSGAAWWQLPLVAAGYLILLGAALAPQTMRRERS